MRWPERAGDWWTAAPSRKCFRFPRERGLRQDSATPTAATPGGMGPAPRRAVRRPAGYRMVRGSVRATASSCSVGRCRMFDEEMEMPSRKRPSRNCNPSFQGERPPVPESAAAGSSSWTTKASWPTCQTVRCSSRRPCRPPLPGFSKGCGRWRRKAAAAPAISPRSPGSTDCR